MEKLNYSTIGVWIPKGYKPGLYDFTGELLTIQLLRTTTESNSPEKKCCWECSHHDVGCIKCSFNHCHNPKCKCHKPKDKNYRPEPDFIERKIEQFEKLATYEGDVDLLDGINFLRTALEEALETNK